MSYLQEIIEVVKPNKYVFIAVDGVAPNAKIRQQRERRLQDQIQKQAENKLRTLQGWNQEYEQILQEMKKGDEDLDNNLFSASITAGSQLMIDLHNHMINRINDWQQNKIFGNIKIEVSGHRIQGEGEHKIIHKIKEKTQKFSQEFDFNYKFQKTQTKKIKFQFTENQIEDEIDEFPYDNPQSSKQQEIESHIVYSQDGDVILLTLSLNIPEIYLLKRYTGPLVVDTQNVNYGSLDPWRSGLILVDIQTIREGIIFEILDEHLVNFNSIVQLLAMMNQTPFVKNVLDFYKQNGQNVEIDNSELQIIREYVVFSELADRIIIDFIALTLFLGNDFIPQVPGMTIKNNALDNLIDIYKQKNVYQIPFKYLVNKDYKFEIKAILQLFADIEQYFELKQIQYDISNLLKLVKTIQEETEDKKFRGSIRQKDAIMYDYHEFQKKLDDLNIDNVMGIIKQNKDKSQIYKIQRAYKQQYYQKFNNQSDKQKIVPLLGDQDEIINKITQLIRYRLNKQEITEQKIAQVEPIVELLENCLQCYQWVMQYYLSTQVDISFEFKYQFTPMMSDMSYYCRALLKLTEDELKQYSQQVFSFTNNTYHKSLLFQQLIVISKNDYQKQLPECIAQQPYIQEFLSQQPSLEQDIYSVDYQSAFPCFNAKMDLTEYVTLVKNSMQVISYGYQPQFKVFHKNYIGGNVSNIDFQKLDDKLQQIVSELPEEQQKYLEERYKSETNTEVIDANEYEEVKVPNRYRGLHLLGHNIDLFIDEKKVGVSVQQCNAITLIKHVKDGIKKRQLYYVYDNTQNKEQQLQQVIEESSQVNYVSEVSSTSSVSALSSTNIRLNQIAKIYQLPIKIIKSIYNQTHVENIHQIFTYNNSSIGRVIAIIDIEEQTVYLAQQNKLYFQKYKPQIGDDIKDFIYNLNQLYYGIEVEGEKRYALIMSDKYQYLEPDELENKIRKLFTKIQKIQNYRAEIMQFLSQLRWYEQESISLIYPQQLHDYDQRLRYLTSVQVKQHEQNVNLSLSPNIQNKLIDIRYEPSYEISDDKLRNYLQENNLNINVQTLKFFLINCQFIVEQEQLRIINPNVVYNRKYNYNLESKYNQITFTQEILDVIKQYRNEFQELFDWVLNYIEDDRYRKYIDPVQFLEYVQQKSGQTRRKQEVKQSDKIIDSFKNNVNKPLSITKMNLQQFESYLSYAMFYINTKITPLNDMQLIDQNLYKNKINVFDNQLLDKIHEQIVNYQGIQQNILTSQIDDLMWQIFYHKVFKEYCVVIGQADDYVLLLMQNCKYQQYNHVSQKNYLYDEYNYENLVFQGQQINIKDKQQQLRIKQLIKKNKEKIHRQSIENNRKLKQKDQIERDSSEDSLQNDVK